MPRRAWKPSLTIRNWARAITIAMRDMELRGAGDLLGGAQSGHVSAVGLDLYTRLLANAVKRRKAEQAGRVDPL
jgi:transcription-repair coupling factor (superfamily II helicase)